MSKYWVIERGAPYSPEYKLYFYGPNGPISPFHDIPLFACAEKRELNMVVEIPRWTNAKMEINKEQRLNPIVQDVKNGKLRFVDNVFPHHGYIWNYGALPQTWEDPNHTDERTQAKGDNDPLDVCEIGYRIHPRGSVVRVKPLGILAMIDEGETDWKLLAIDTTDPLAEKLNDIADIETHMPGFLDSTRSWFRNYKVPQGKPRNEFAFNGEFQGRDFALSVVDETHRSWQSLVGHVIDRNAISCDNVSVIGSAYKIDQSEARELVEKQPAVSPPCPIPPEVSRWHYLPAE